MGATFSDHFGISTGVVRRVVEEKSSLLVLDTALDGGLFNRQSILLANVKSIMALPLQTEDSVIGIIYVDSHEHVHPFTADDLNLLTVMANIAATRIEHSRLLEIEQAEKILARDGPSTQARDSEFHLSMLLSVSSQVLRRGSQPRMTLL